MNLISNPIENMGVNIYIKRKVGLMCKKVIYCLPRLLNLCVRRVMLFDSELAFHIVKMLGNET